MDELARRWHPSRGWRDVVDAAGAALARDPADCKAWCQLAMVFGDTHAPELALIVCEHARTLDGDQQRVRAHASLCLLDLGLAPSTGKPVPLRSLGEPGVVDAYGDKLAAWIAEHLAPFEGDAARAARHALAIAIARFTE